MTGASRLQRPVLPVAATMIEYLRARRSARRPAAAVALDQRARLAATVARARRDVPLYRKLYRDLPEDGLAELTLLPFLDKQIVRSCSHEERLSGPVPLRSRHLSTSGTTGEPTTTDWPPGTAWYQGVLTLRMAFDQGLSPFHRRVAFAWRTDRRTSTGGLFGWLRKRHVELSAFEDPATLATALQAARPDAVWGQSQLLIEIGPWLEPTFRTRVVNTVGQDLTSEDRAAVGRIYGCEPFDVYSTSEHGVVAWQCAASDLYHINHETVIVEVLDELGRQLPAGTSGELVSTGLTNPLMPYLRYRTGDAGVFATRPCRCGSTLPALLRVEGRISDWFLDEHGGRVAPHRLWLSSHLDRGLELVRRYQVRQFPSRRVEILLVPTAEIDASTLRSLQESYQRLLGLAVPVVIQLVERLADEPSRKFRTIMAVSDDDSRAGRI